MKRVDSILKHVAFLDYMTRIHKAEETRIYCKHGLAHCMDVARICYILNLEENLGYDKEVIYAMALLHDIGRCEEYETKTPHHAIGASLAEPILADCGFLAEEIRAICSAIAEHKEISENADSLNALLYRGDKLSRNCFACKAQDTCYWHETQKNKGVIA